uniref:Class III homeodomain-leucine zipper protein n=1 Tax=Ceratopteris pteridoides TaxID=58167 RepID=A0A2S1CVL2_9MONI|nr:class III homeodomain-leucine zipper protein [Ceratopteris pteridoides]
MLMGSSEDRVSVYNRGLPLMPSRSLDCSTRPLHAECDNSKYVRYTMEQVQALEKLYNECPKPSSLRRQQLIRENPVLQNIEPKQIKVWFQNRRCREKQRKESIRLHTVNAKLTAINRLLMDENDRLQRQATQLLYENGSLRKQLEEGGITAEISCDSAAMSALQRQSTPDATYSGLLFLADDILLEFLGKATGSSVDWIPIPGMKPGPDSTDTINISTGCGGVAARACGLVNMEAEKILEVIKDKASWHTIYRRVVTLFSTTTTGGACIEVRYTQTYAPTILVPPRDYYTLRFSSPLEDGSFVVCEGSIKPSQDAEAPQAQPFIRADLHASGCLIKPCNSTSSIVILIDQMDLKPLTVPEVLRPLYESSAILGRSITMPVLRHLRHLANDPQFLCPPSEGRRQHAAVRSLSYRLAKGFNDALSSFADDGWTPTASDGVDDISIAAKLPMIDKGLSPCPRTAQKCIMCAKASMLLQNVSPCKLICFLREHRSEWASATLDEALHIGNPGFFGFPPEVHTHSQLLPDVNTVDHSEFLELIKMEDREGEGSLSGTRTEVFLLQLCSGLEETGSGTTAQMVYAPIDASISDDAELRPSGFRVVSLDNINSNLVGGSSVLTLELASGLETTACKRGSESPDNMLSDNTSRSVLSMAFQFNIDIEMENSMAEMAKQYMRKVMSTLQRVALILVPPSPNLLLVPSNKPCSQSPTSANNHREGSKTIAHWICRSYKMYLGLDLLHAEKENNETQFEALWKLNDALLCCNTSKLVPRFSFANQAGLEMLEVCSGAKLQDVTFGKTIINSGSRSTPILSVIEETMQQGYTYLPAGIKRSSKGRLVAYERGIAWKVIVQTEEELSVHGVAFLYMNWTLSPATKGLGRAMKSGDSEDCQVRWSPG